MLTEELIGTMIYDSDKNDSRRPISYKIEGVLGVGGFGKVLKVSRSKYDLREGKEIVKYYALKTIPKRDILEDSILKRRVITEIKLHRQLNHKHICKFEHSFDDEENVNILLEYCPNTSLQNLLRQRKQHLTEFETRYYMFQVLQALMFLKRQKVVHRDLTLSNIFLSEDYSVKVGDFGLSFKETCEEDRKGKVCGTQPYLAPEITGNSIIYSSKTDIWAFGIDIFELLTGRLLFESPEHAIERLPNFSFDRSVKISDEAKSLLLQIFVKEQERIDLYDIYTHPFFNQGINIGSDIALPTYEIPSGEENNKEKIAKIEKVFIDEIDELASKITITYSKDNYGLLKTSPKELKDSNSKDSILLPIAIKPHNIGRIGSMKGNQQQIDNFALKNSVMINPFAEILNPGTNDKVSIPIKGFYSNRMSYPTSSALKTILTNSTNYNNANNTTRNAKQSNLIDKEDSIPLAAQRNKTVDKVLMFKPNNNDVKSNGKQIEALFCPSPISNNSNSHREYLNEFSPCSSSRNVINNIFFNNNNSTNSNIDDFFKQSLENSSKKNSSSSADEVIILNHIDESRKYGIGYELSNGMHGVYFNDGVKMVSNSKELFYWSREAKSDYTLHQLPLKINYGLSASIGNAGNILKTKYQILNCFINEFKKIKKGVNELGNANAGVIFLRKWKRASRGILFLLSNKNLQITFFDKTKMVFVFERKIVKYYDENNNCQEYNAETLTNVNCSDEKINQKLTYAIREFRKGC